MESSGVGLFEELSEVRSISTFSIQLAYNYWNALRKCKEQLLVHNGQS
jgi:hypothetical protein